jgi:uncharacterized protein (TIGR02284 family)
MPMTNDQVISTLNRLIHTNKDAEQGFQTGAEGLKDSQLKSQFEEFSHQRMRFATELQEEVQRLGGKPATGGDVAGALHRGWMNIRSLVQAGDAAAILSEAERGEDRAKEHYEDALKQELPANVQALLERQYRQVLETHDSVRASRDAAKARKAA